MQAHPRRHRYPAAQTTLAAACVLALLYTLPAQTQNTEEEAPPARAEEAFELPAGEGPSVEAMGDVERALEAYEASEQISEDAAVSFPVDI